MDVAKPLKQYDPTPKPSDLDLPDTIHPFEPNYQLWGKLGYEFNRYLETDERRQSNARRKLVNFPLLD